MTEDPDLVIREYSEADLPLLEEYVFLLQESLRSIEGQKCKGGEIRSAYTKDLIDKVIKQKGLILLAKAKEKEVGFISFYVDKESDELDDFVYISDLFVREGFQGRGYGKKLLSAAEDYANKINVRFLRIASLSQNKAALGLYKKFGYEEYVATLQKRV